VRLSAFIPTNHLTRVVKFVCLGYTSAVRSHKAKAVVFASDTTKQTTILNTYLEVPLANALDRGIEFYAWLSCKLFFCNAHLVHPFLDLHNNS
jgi:hypothetical protein